jgi:aryl-alcohol dehydrogenase-like predicted oxidoreductase
MTPGNLYPLGGSQPPMEYRRLPGTELEVSTVGFGLWSVATPWWARFTDAQAIRLLRRARSLGVNLFDTAPGYGEGRADRLLAEAFPGRERGDLVILAKLALHPSRPRGSPEPGPSEAPRLEGFALAGPPYDEVAIRRQLEATLGRLGRSQVEALEVHNPTLRELRDGTLRAGLEGLVRSGAALSWGVALGPSIGWLEEGLWALEHGADHLMTVYNLLEREPGETLARRAEGRGKGIFARVPHASGALDGSSPSFGHYPSGDHRSLRDASWLQRARRSAEVLRPHAEGRGRTLGELAILALLAEPSVVSVFPTFLTEEEVDRYGRLDRLLPVTLEEARAIRAELEERGAEVASP